MVRLSRAPRGSLLGEERGRVVLGRPVAQQLEQGGGDVSRPENLDPEFGLHKDGYQLSLIQAQEILNMRLHRLTGLEQEKLTREYEEILELVKDLLAILSDPERLMEVIRDELVEVRDQYGDERRTEITASQHDLTDSSSTTNHHPREKEQNGIIIIIIIIRYLRYQSI